MASLIEHRERVRDEWVDYNGHLRDAYYLLAFSHATDALMERIGLDAAGRERMHASLYTLEARVRYLHEVRSGQELRVATRVVGMDAKRVHLHHTLWVGEHEAATGEMLLLHVDTRGPRGAPFAAEVAQALRAIAEGQADLPLPDDLGRAIGLAR